MMQEGNYFGYVAFAECLQLNNANKTPYMGVTFNVTHYPGPDGNWEELPQSEQRMVRLFMSDRAWPYTEAKLADMKFDGNFDNPGFGEPFRSEGCELVCKHTEDKGKTYENWDIAGGAGGGEKLDGEVQRRLAAKWKQGQGSKPTGRPAAPARPAANPATAPAATATADLPTGEEIPF
jgi:hypothetical protein